ncbi:hypothetical protein MPSEU_000387800 [Mayamaea pseudoterrestris]|nr:hypothetical protein MPSEU_000387800 [Mayamaea pseudoterrestris]
MRLLDKLLGMLLLAILVRAEECERLQSGLSYSQEEAPRDLSLLPNVIARVNRILEGVTNVQVDWHGGDLHGRVGEHTVQCRVTRLASVLPNQSDGVFTDSEGRSVVEQCFHVHLTITDTNECNLPHGHPMQHQCHEPAICINTIGSYECLCPRIEERRELFGVTADDDFWHTVAKEERDPWELSFASHSRSTCPSSMTTFGCCSASAHTDDGSTCRAGFHCPADPCGKGAFNECADNAICVKKPSPTSIPNYECHCPEGLMGSGRKCRIGIDRKPEPKVMFDGVTPTEETIKNDFYCGCTRPVVDACAGFPPCKGKHEVCTVTERNEPECRCKPGYVMHEDYGCVDESPPKLRLSNDPDGTGVLRLKQGDFYQEYAVEILDENAEDYLRSLKVSYSHPLPQGCLTKIGQFHVNYTVATPWTSPSQITITRQVIIEDIDECAIDRSEFMQTCPELVPHCDIEAGARCVNTIGGYTCKCPQFTTGDGFERGVDILPGSSPEGYHGGTSCIDTGAPVIKLKGPNPKIFRVSECSGITGVMGGRSSAADLIALQKQHYADDIAQMISSTAGAELCASASHPNPHASDCVEAYDDTYKGRVDLTRKVVVGEPVQKSPTGWSVPYDVVDEAGNSAKTVWRDVIVEEVNLAKLEASVRREVQEEMQAEKEEAVRLAVAAERKKKVTDAPARKAREVTNTCQCPVCDTVCSDAKDANNYCDPGSRVIQALVLLEGFMSRSLAQSLLILCVAFGAYLVLSTFCSTVLVPPSQRRRDADFEAHSEERVRAIQQGIAYIPSNELAVSRPDDGSLFDQDRYRSTPLTSPRVPRTSVFLNGDAHRDFLSPNGTTALQNGQGPSPGAIADDYYDSPFRITPSKRGDGVHRRSPYGSAGR